LSLDILTFSVDELEDKIKTVGFTGHYRENIEQVCFTTYTACFTCYHYNI
jgi:hypothetical protein